MSAAVGPTSGLIDELRAKSAGSMRLASLLCIVSFVAFAAVDPLLVEGSVRNAYIVRGLLVLTFTALAATTLREDFYRRWAGSLMAGACLTAGIGVNVLTLLTGGGNSQYHSALIIVFFAFALLPSPWRRSSAWLLFGALALIYDGLLLAFGATGDLGNWVANNAVVWAAVMIAGALFHFAMGLREDDFANRQRLAAANERLQALDKAKSRFFANVSHELRTPLTLALAPVQALLEEQDGLSEGQRDQLQMVERNSLRLLRLVDDLLELSKAEAASLRMSPERVELREFTAGLVAQVAPLAARKHLELELEAGSPVRPIHADPDHLERVLLNLLGNAVKFTPEGGRITVRAYEENERLYFEVSDTGQGIPEEELARVFHRFHQVDASSTRVHGGTGIGLALVRELVELHGGQVFARSPDGEGATVGFWLPAGTAHKAVASAPRPPTNEVEGLPEWHDALRRQDAYRLRQIQDATERRLAPRAPAGARSHTVLVVEDNADMVRFIGTLLSSEHHVLTSTDGLAGLRIAYDRRPDLIISDVMMPGLNGFELVSRLREDPATRPIPVILLTARGAPEDRLAGRQQGADAYLTKPFQAAELMAAVRALLAKRGALMEDAEARRNESVQYLAGGIADELNRPLAAIEAALRAAGGESATEPLDELRGAIADLEALARTSTEEKVPLRFTDLVNKALPDEEALEGVSLDVDLRSNGTITGRPNELRRAVVHVLDNALRSTRPGGRVTVRSWDEPDGGVSLSISDEGPGVSSEHAERIFQPFYSTRPGGRGMGLPLARRIVEAHGGRLALAPGGPGATFVIHLSS